MEAPEAYFSRFFRTFSSKLVFFEHRKNLGKTMVFSMFSRSRRLENRKKTCDSRRQDLCKRRSVTWTLKNIAIFSLGGLLGAILEALGRSWGALGLSWGPLGRVLGVLGRVLGAFGRRTGRENSVSKARSKENAI